MLFEIIVPVMDLSSYDLLLESILKNTVLPSRIIVINNSRNTFSRPAEIPTKVLHPLNPPLPTNKAWNLGVSRLSNCKFASIINDDIILPNTFFERVEKAFKRIPDAAVICPNTVSDMEGFGKLILRRNDYCVSMKRKEGWAFTIKKDVLDKIPPIPDNLEMFFGDDYYWWWCWRNVHKFWYKDMGMTVFHKIGRALKKIPTEDRALMKKGERAIFYALKNQLIRDGIFDKI